MLIALLIVKKNLRWWLALNLSSWRLSAWENLDLIFGLLRAQRHSVRSRLASRPMLFPAKNPSSFALTAMSSAVSLNKHRLRATDYSGCL